MKAHLGSDLVEGLGQEAGRARSGLESPKRVPSGLSWHARGLGHAVEQRRHDLMLPALDTAQLVVGVHRGLSGQVKEPLGWR